MDYEKLKGEAKKRKCKVDDLLALSSVNDPFYIQPNDKEKGEWVAKIWKKEGSPTIHPRGFHYRIIDKGYKMPNSIAYQNSEKCWNFIQSGFKYGKLLGLIPNESILDMKNGKPTETGEYSEHSRITYEENYFVEPYDEEYYEDDDEYIETLINKIYTQFEVGFNHDSLQPFYIELWAEKSGVIPEDVAYRFRATTREAGGGEFSFDMCYQALKRAKELNRALFVFVLSDFDPKGKDMPKSISRKLEILSKRIGIDAYVKHISLTKEQCEKYNLPEIPAKEPKTNSTGAKAYKTHTKNFYDAMNRETTEINSFMAKNEEAYEEEISKGIEPYYDNDMLRKISNLIKNIQQQIKDQIGEVIESNREEIIENAKELATAKEELAEFYKQKREELGVGELESEFRNLTEINSDEIKINSLYELPQPDFKYPKEALLDTTRDYFEQLKHYKKDDIRTQKKEEEVEDV